MFYVTLPKKTHVKWYYCESYLLCQNTEKYWFNFWIDT